MYFDHLKHENPSILNFSESVEMPIDIPRVSVRDLDRLVAAIPGPSLLYAADGTGGASSSLPNLVVSLTTVATNEVAEISLPTVASLLPVVSLPPVATVPNSLSTTIATTSISAGNSSNDGPRALAVSDSSIDNCDSETRIDHQVDDLIILTTTIDNTTATVCLTRILISKTDKDITPAETKTMRDSTRIPHTGSKTMTGNQIRVFPKAQYTVSILNSKFVC